MGMNFSRLKRRRRKKSLPFIFVLFFTSFLSLQMHVKYEQPLLESVTQIIQRENPKESEVTVTQKKDSGSEMSNFSARLTLKEDEGNES